MRSAPRERRAPVATVLPLVMLAAFVAASVAHPGWQWLAYVRAFAGAALVAAAAAWFALASLFRRPLGLPIAHAALVPQYRARLADDLGRFVATRLLGTDAVRARLRDFGPAERVAVWMNRTENVAAAARALRGAFASVGASTDDDTSIRTAARDAVLAEVRAVPAAPLAAHGLSALVRSGYHDALFDAALGIAARYVAENRSELQRVGLNAMPFAGWIGSLVSDAVASEIASSLAAAKRPNHPWRAAYARSLDRAIRALSEDAETAARAERIKNDVLNAETIEAALTWIARPPVSDASAAASSCGAAAFGGAAPSSGRSAAAPGAAAASHPGDSAGSGLERLLARFGQALNDDAALRERLDERLQHLASAALAPRRDAIGAYVSRLVTGPLPDGDGGTFVADVRRDLARVHANATVAGGIAGLALFALFQLLQSR